MPNLLHVVFVESESAIITAVPVSSARHRRHLLGVMQDFDLHSPVPAGSSCTSGTDASTSNSDDETGAQTRACQSPREEFLKNERCAASMTATTELEQVSDSNENVLASFTAESRSSGSARCNEDDSNFGQKAPSDGQCSTDSLDFKFPSVAGLFYHSASEDLEDTDQDDSAQPSDDKRARDLLVHTSGICKPCRFFQLKEGGCRLGDLCAFCHLCDREQAKADRRRTKYEDRRVPARKKAEAANKRRVDT